jgi:hypothetical protein
MNLKNPIMVLTKKIREHQNEVDKLNEVDIEMNATQLFVDEEIKNQKQYIDELIYAINILLKNER